MSQRSYSCFVPNASFPNGFKGDVFASGPAEAALVFANSRAIAGEVRVRERIEGAREWHRFNIELVERAITRVVIERTATPIPTLEVI